MPDRENYIGRYLLALVISVVIFAIIFSIAYGVSYLNYGSVQSGNNAVAQDLKEMDLILNQTVCTDEGLYHSSQILDEVGKALSILEKRFGINNQRVIDQKIIYTELEFKHSLIVDKLNKNCGAKFTSVFFFYSNLADKKDESTRIGYIVTTFKQSNVEKVMVYSFDYNLNSKVINDLKKNLNLTDVPSVFVNHNTSVNVRNIEDLQKYLN